MTQSYGEPAEAVPNLSKSGAVPAVPANHHPASVPAGYPAGYPAPVPATYAAAGPVGKIRSTGVCILLAIVTLGIYAIFWFAFVHKEMKEHSRSGLGGGLAALLSLFVGIVMPFITSSEVGSLYRVRGQQPPVSGATGLWSFPGSFIVVGPLVWFVKTNGALNAYWRSLGAR